MPEKDSVYLLKTRVVKERSSTPIGHSFSFDLWSSLKRKKDGGFLIGDHRGKILLKVNGGIKSPSIILHSLQNLFGVEQRVVKRLGGVVAERIINYIQDYYEKYPTNCSTLVEFLRTGVFTECVPEKKTMMFSSGMNLYTGQKIEMGDSLCVLYYRRGILSRRVPSAIRNSYKQNRGLAFDELSVPKKKWNLTSEGFLGLLRSGFFSDYHFMFCIGIDNNRPIFIQQNGFIESRDINTSKTIPAIFTFVGLENTYPDAVPVCMFIKKGRK